LRQFKKSSFVQKEKEPINKNKNKTNGIRTKSPQILDSIFLLPLVQVGAPWVSGETVAPEHKVVKSLRM
jgi:hypothetical protein